MDIRNIKTIPLSLLLNDNKLIVPFDNISYIRSSLDLLNHEITYVKLKAGSELLTVKESVKEIWEAICTEKED